MATTNEVPEVDVSAAMSALGRRRWAEKSPEERKAAARKAGLGNRSRSAREMAKTNRANARKGAKARGKKISDFWAKNPELLAERNRKIAEARAKRKRKRRSKKAAAKA